MCPSEQVLQTQWGNQGRPGKSAGRPGLLDLHIVRVNLHLDGCGSSRSARDKCRSSGSRLQLQVKRVVAPVAGQAGCGSFQSLRSEAFVGPACLAGLGKSWGLAG